MGFVRRWAPPTMCLGIAMIASAQARQRHEYVPDVRSNEGTLLISSGAEEPDAIVYDGEILPAPEGGALHAGEVPMRGRPGDGRGTEEAGLRSPTFRPDRETQLNGTLGYYGVFTPTITPFKRVTALDSVILAGDGTPMLVLEPSPHVAVGVVGAEAAPPDARPRDRFWGSVVLDFSDGRSVPFPSVSPESRVLTLRTEPSIDLRIERDAADNFFAIAPSSSAPRQVRVVFLMDAPRSYFGMSLPEGHAANELAAHVHPLPPELAQRALGFAREHGLTPESSYARAVTTLGEHFRSFEESAQPPRDTGDIYLDLARGMRGVCRHRAYAFVITALALGIPARFVENEAHAWAEVEVPAQGWLRIDLGGAATGLDPRGEENRPAYTPDVQDPLPRPEPYQRAYEQARAAAARRAATNGTSPGASPSTSPAGPQSRDDSDGQTSAEAPSANGLSILLDHGHYDVKRGHELELAGQARAHGNGVTGLRIEVLLRAPRGDRERLLGVTVSGEQGRFHAVFGVPHDLAVGDYRLVVRTPGDARFGPAQAL